MHHFGITTILLLVTFFQFNARADFAPTVYGNLHFEYRYWQHAAQNYSPITAGGSTVENFPNRLGVYGMIPTSNFDDTKLTYVAEMSLAPRKNPGEVNLRLVAANLENSWGKFTIGQCYTAASLTGLEFDPLHTTGAGQIGYDLTYDGKTNQGLSGIGYSSRWYNDTVKYTSPRMGGFQLSFSVDRDSAPRMKNNGPSPFFDKEILAHPNSAPATYYEALVNHQWQNDQYTRSTYFGVISGSGSTYSLDFSTYVNQDQRFYLGHKVRWQNLASGALYSQTQQKGQFAVSTLNTKRWLYFVSYFHDLWQYDLTWGLAMSDADTTHSMTDLLAASVMRQIAPTANMRLSAFHYQASLANKNTIYGLNAGLYLKF